MKSNTRLAPRPAALCALFAAALLWLTSCGANVGAESDPSTIKIGFITVSTGPFADNGNRATQGVEYAVERINAEGGIDGARIELVRADTRGDISSLGSTVRQMITRDRVLAIVGPILSGECEVACALANDLKTPIISPGAGQPGILENARPYGFSLVQPDGENSGPAITEIIESEGINSAALIIDESQAVTQAQRPFWEQVFSENGVNLVSTQTITAGDASFAAQVTEIAGANPQAVALAAGPADAARIAQEIRRQNLDAQLLGMGALQSAGGDFIQAGGDAVEGTMTAAQFDPDNPDETARQLIDRYTRDTGEDITLNAAYGFDAINIIAQMIRDRDVSNESDSLEADRELIQQGINELEGYVGMGGDTTFGDDGVVKRPSQIATIENGQFVITQVGS